MDSSGFAGYSDSTEFVKNLRKKLTGVVEASQRIPKGEMNYLICSTYPDFVERAGTASSQLTSMMKNLSSYWGVPAATYRQFEAPQNRAAVVQGVDETVKQLKERMDLTLDELIRLKDEHASGKLVPKVAIGAASPKKALGKQAQVQRPQVTHGWIIDNSKSHFVPKLKAKPNALRSLEYSMREHVEGEPAPHPYQFELELFEPEQSALKTREPIMAQPAEETPFAYVDTPDELSSILVELARASEIAVDVEHHSYRTYLGITCLIQLSTREKDYVIDTIALRDRIHKLNDVFTNPKILKVFHGGNMDTQWLQRDFGVYVVNMFDTGQAARMLSMPKYSLSYLFSHYLNKSVDKSHQLSDWRLRPLPDDMIAYAQSDTHDLLYFYDCVRNELIKKDRSLVMLQEVYAKSKALCLQRYEKVALAEDDFAYIMWKFAKNFSEQQKYALKKLLEWRDQVARDADESIGYVLPTKSCVDLAEELPRTPDDLVKSVEFVPNLLKQKIHQVLQIVKEARNFVGIVPMPVSIAPRPDLVETESKERQILRPVSGHEFCAKYVNVIPRAHHTELVCVPSRNRRFVDDVEKELLEQLWNYSLTVKTAEKEMEEVEKPEDTPYFTKPVSQPKDLPLADVAGVSPKRNKIREINQAVMDVCAQRNAPGSVSTSVKKTFLVPVSASSATATQSSTVPVTKASAPQTTANLEKPPTKRPAFDYATADYSKFAAPSGGQQGIKRPGGRTHQSGGVRDPNKSFNKNRNMSQAFPASGPGRGKFRKPE